MRDLDISFWFKLNAYSSSVTNPFDSTLLRLRVNNGYTLIVHIIDPYVVQLICMNSNGVQQTFRSKRAVGNERILTNVCIFTYMTNTYMHTYIHTD